MPHWLVAAFARYGYAVVVVGVFLENVGIPVPGETVVLAAGFFARRHVLRLAIVIPCAIVAAIAGDNFGYWIGKRRGRAFAERYGRWIGINRKRLDHAETYFRKNGPKAIFFARFISGIRVVAAIFAGVSGIAWPRFFAYNAAGAVAWGTTIASLGYFFGNSWPLLERWVGRTGLILLLLAVIAVVAVKFIRRHK